MKINIFIITQCSFSTTSFCCCFLIGIQPDFPCRNMSVLSADFLKSVNKKNQNKITQVSKIPDTNQCLVPALDGGSLGPRNKLQPSRPTESSAISKRSVDSWDLDRKNSSFPVGWGLRISPLYFLRQILVLPMARCLFPWNDSHSAGFNGLIH